MDSETSKKRIQKIKGDPEKLDKFKQDQKHYKQFYNAATAEEGEERFVILRKNLLQRTNNKKQHYDTTLHDFLKRMQLKKDMKLNQDFQVTLSDLQCLIREEINDFDKGMKKCINFEMRESEMEGVNVLFHLMGYKKFVEYLFDDFELYINMVFQDFEENYEFHFIRFWNLEDFRRRSMLQIDLHTSKWKAKIEQFKLLPNSRLFQKEIMKCQEIINDSYTIIESTLTKSIIVMNNHRDQDQTVFSMYHEDFFNLRDDMNDLKQKLITWMRNTEIEDAKIDLILNECKQNIKLNDAKNANNLELDDKGGNDVELDEGSSESFEEEEE